MMEHSKAITPTNIEYLFIKCTNCDEKILVNGETLIPNAWYGYQCVCGEVTNIRTIKGLSNDNPM